MQIICIIPGSLNRFLELVYEVNSDALIISQALIACSTGFIYSIVYGMNKQVKELIKNSFSRDSIFLDDNSSNLSNNMNNIDNRISFIGE